MPDDGDSSMTTWRSDHVLPASSLWRTMIRQNSLATWPLLKELRDFVAREIGAIAKPDLIHFAPGLPKTRSGKIMRRILRKIAANELDTLGDTSTLADPAVVDQLISGRMNS